MSRDSRPLNVIQLQTRRQHILHKDLHVIKLLIFPVYFRIGSWIYDLNQLNLIQKSPNVDMSHYVTNNEYELRNITLDRVLMRYDMFSDDYPQVTIKLHIRRKPLYYSYTVVAPVIVSVMNKSRIQIKSVPYGAMTSLLSHVSNGTNLMSILY